MPTAAQVHIDAALSNISIAYRNQDYIADLLFPQVPVDKQSDKYHIWDKEFWFRNYVQTRAPGDTYPEGMMKLSSAAYYARLYHLAYPIPDEIVANQDVAVDVETAGAEWLADQFALNRELMLRDAIFVSSVWDTDVTGVTDFDQWDDYANSDPTADYDLAAQTIRKNTGREPNILAVGREVYDKLRRHPLLLEKYKYTRAGPLTPELVAEAIGAPKLLIGNAVNNAAREGATFSGGFIWGKNALALYVTPTPGLLTPNAGYTYVWDIDQAGFPVQVSRIREENRDRDLLKSKHAFDHKVTASDLGYMMLSAVA